MVRGGVLFGCVLLIGHANAVGLFLGQCRTSNYDKSRDEARPCFVAGPGYRHAKRGRTPMRCVRPSHAHKVGGENRELKCKPGGKHPITCACDHSTWRNQPSWVLQQIQRHAVVPLLGYARVNTVVRSSASYPSCTPMPVARRRTPISPCRPRGRTRRGQRVEGGATLRPA